MNQTNPYLSVIIPAYNEQGRIMTTLEAVYAYLQKRRFSWEMLIVNDGSTDNTMQVVADFAQDKTGIRWLDRAENQGKGYTVREGMLAARGQIRLFTDADNSTDMSHFDKMRPLFDEGYGVVICSRDPKDANGASQAVPQPFLKRVLGNSGNLFIQLMAVPGIWDTQCGFKAFSAVAARDVFSVAKSDGWAFDIESLALARRFGHKVAVIPAHWIDNADTHVTLGTYLEVLLDTIRIRLRLWSGVYGRKKSAPENPAKMSVREL